MVKPVVIAKFVDLLRKECPEARVDIDAPSDPNGEWMIDVVQGRFRTSVAWRSAFGFGIFTASDQGIGEGPDEIFRDADNACARLVQLMRRARGGAASEFMMLKELRQLRQTSQLDLAEAMQKDQAFISRLEGRDDMLLSSLVQYIEAMGGQLELRARFEKWEARIDPAAVVRVRGRT